VNESIPAEAQVEALALDRAVGREGAGKRLCSRGTGKRLAESGEHGWVEGMGGVEWSGVE